MMEDVVVKKKKKRKIPGKGRAGNNTPRPTPLRGPEATQWDALSGGRKNVLFPVTGPRITRRCEKQGHL